MAEVVVVGGGIGGLAAAARLAKLGHRATLCERADALGGLLRPVEQDGFGWDTVDSFTLPAVLRDLFRKSGRPVERYLDLQMRAPARRVVFSDGAMVDLPTGSRGGQSTAIEAGLGADAASEWTRFVDDQADRWQVLRQQVLDPVDGLQRLADPDVSRAVGAGSTLDTVLRKGLRDPRLRLLAAHGVLVAGGDPAAVPGQVAVDPYVERTFGVWQVVGGSGQLAKALAARLGERGVDVRLNCDVASIEVVNGEVAGVSTAAGDRLAADMVVTDLDVRRVVGTMLPGTEVPDPVRRWADADHLPGPTVSYLGLRDDLPTDLPEEVVWYGDRLVVLRRGGSAPAGHTAVTVLCQPMPVRALQAPNRSAWSRLSRRLRVAGHRPPADDVRTSPMVGVAAGNDENPDVVDPLEVLAARGLDLRPQLVCRVDRSAAELAAAAGGPSYGLGWQLEPSTDARERRRSGELSEVAAARARLANPLPGLYCLGAGLPLPATLPYVTWQAATVATAIGKA